jgi:hypothetical protein
MPSLAAKILLHFTGQTWALTAPSPSVGAELLTNGDFSAWTGDDPDGWAITGEVGGDPAIHEVGDGEDHTGSGSGYCNIYSSATSFAPQMRQVVLAVGEWFSLAVNINTATAEVVRVRDISEGIKANLSGAGVSQITGKAANETCQLDCGFFTPSENTLASVSIKLLSDTLAGVNTNHIRQTVHAGLTIADGYQGGVWSDGDATTAPNNYLLAYYDRNTNKVHIAKWLSGSYDSELGAVVVAYSAGSELKIVPDGDDRQVWYNGVKLATYTLTDAALINGTCAGLFATDNSSVSFTDAVVEV